jgi:ATP-dependent helicase/nuclease subunit A
MIEAIEPGKSPTLEQTRALEVQGASVALSAGAGTGKTFVLAERFVRALDAPENRPLGRVVALTFTNKAARELRERIRKECRNRLERGNDPARWRGILRGLEAARIGTFHAFCGEILRQHAIEAGVDPGFTVFEESIALAIRQGALDASLREALLRRDPDLIDLAVEFGLSIVRQSIEILLANRSAGEIREWADQEPRELVQIWQKIWGHEVQPALLDRFRQNLRPALDLIERNRFDNPKVQVRLNEFSDAMALLNIPGDPIPALNAIAEAAKIQGLVAKLWPSKEIYDSISDHFKQIRNEARKLVEVLPWDEPSSLEAAEHGLRFARLAIQARGSYDQAKRDRGGIDHDDLLLIARELLARPFSMARDALEKSVDLVLVDEFQDTDPVQAEILERLAGSDLLGGKLFLVGDVKQSIYRFRGARPELFEKYRSDFPLQGQLELSTNFRSSPAILAFVNALFASTFTVENAALQPGLGSFDQVENSPAAIEFLWEPEAPETKASEKPDVNARRRQEARRIARHLKTRLEQGWWIVDPTEKTPRIAHQGDIAFLFRSLSDASHYEQALVAEGLDYHVVGGSGFFAQQEVLDLINVLTAVEDPLDAVSMAGTLRSPFFSISDDALFWISTNRIGQPHEGLERCVGDGLDKLPEADRPRADRARRLLQKWRSVKDRLPIASLLDQILTESGYEAALIGEFLGDRKRANARKLVDMARRFDEQGGFTLADFVDRLRADLRRATRETEAATTDEEGEIIRLMSIHQAKGLEFPIVVLPDLDRKRPGEMKRVAFDGELGPLVNPVVEASPSEDGEESDPGGSLGWTIHRHRERIADDAEALRLFYVAVTRARDSLVISSATASSKRPTSPAMTLLDARFDRDTGQFRGILPEGWPEPKVVVVEPGTVSGSSEFPATRPRPRLLEISHAIEDGLTRPSRIEPLPARTPRIFDLDPTFGLSSTSIRLDRLIRTILADPGSLDPLRIEAIARRAARLQDPVSPRSLVDRAIERITGWLRSPEAREISRSSQVRRSIDWVVGWPEVERSTLFRGRTDFLFRLPGGGEGLIHWADLEASEVRERLRLRVGALAVERMGLGKVRRAWWVRPGAKFPPIVIENFDRSAIDAVNWLTQIP